MPIDRKLLVSSEGKLKLGENGQLADKACCCGGCDCTPPKCQYVPTVYIICAAGVNTQCRGTDSASCDIQASLPEGWTDPFLSYDVDVCIFLSDNEGHLSTLTVTIPAGSQLSNVETIPQASPAGNEIVIYDWWACSPFHLNVNIGFDPEGTANGDPEGCGETILTNSACLLLIPTGTPRFATATTTFVPGGCASNQASNGENVDLSASVTVVYLEAPDGLTFSLTANIQINDADTDCSTYEPPEECVPCHCSAIEVETSRTELAGFLDGVAGNTRSWSDNFTDGSTYNYTVAATAFSCGDCTP